MMTEGGFGLPELENISMADLESLQNEGEDDSDNCSEFSDVEKKYDPLMVKEELEYVEGLEEALVEDPFLTSDLGTANDAEAVVAVDSTPSKKKPQQRRRTKVDPDDDDDDDDDRTWAPSTYKPKKTKQVSTKAKRSNKKTPGEKHKAVRKGERSGLTPAPEQKQAETKRKRVLKTEQRNRKGKEKTLKGVVAEDETEDVNEKSSSPAPKTRRNSTRKKASEMTPEELEVARAKWREERRRARGSKLDWCETDNEKRKSRRKPTAEMTEEEREKMRKETKNRRSRLAARKSSHSETDVNDNGTAGEDLEAKKAKWRETARLSRQRRRERMTEEEREAYLAKAREQKRKARQAAKANLTPEELEEIKRQDAQRKFMANLQRKAAMTDDEIREEKQRVYMREVARLARMTPEELEERRRRRNEVTNQKNRERRALWTEEEKEKVREAKRQAFNNLSPEKKARFYRQQKEYYKRKMGKLRQDPEEFAKWKESTDKRKKEMNDLWKKFKNGAISKEELARLEIKMHMGRGRGAYADETPEQRLKRFSGARRKYVRRVDMKKKRKKKQKGMSLDDIKRRKYEDETPQQREHRLMRHRVNSAKNRHRKRLQASGVHPAEIEKKLMEVEEICKAKPTLPYKPRKRRESKPQLNTTKSELENEPSLSGFQIDRQVLDNSRPILHQYSPCHSHLQKQQEQELPDSMEVEGSPPYQVPFIQPPNHETFSHDTQESTGSSSHLVVNAIRNHNHTNYAHSQISYEYVSSESLEPISSPAPSYPEPDGMDWEEVSNDVDNYLPPTPKHEITDRVDNNATSSPSTIFSINQRIAPTPTSKRNVVSDYFQMGRIRGPQKKRVGALERNMICEDCGIAYNRHTYYGHRRLYHNPNFKDGRCVVTGSDGVVCGEQFTVIRDWYYKHYRIVHAPESRDGGRPKSDSALSKIKKIKSEDDPNGLNPPNKPHLCGKCGKSYATLFGLYSHEKFSHGDYQVLKCRLCDHTFKRKGCLYKHLLKIHNAGMWNCEKCDKYYENLAQLHEHLKDDHENSYFACDFCKAVHTSAVAIKFHVNQCKKVPMEKMLELRKKWKEEGDMPVSSTFIGCEFCLANVSVHSLGRHYKDVHGLPPEEKHICKECGKIFKRREHYVCHLAGIHNVPMKECLDVSRPYNGHREGLEPMNPDGKGTKGKPKRERKKKVDKTDSVELSPQSVKAPKKVVASRTRKGRGKPRAKKTEDDSAVHNDVLEEVKSSGESQGKKTGRTESSARKPAVTPIADSSRAPRKSAQMAQKRIHLSQRASDEDESDQYEDYRDEAEDNILAEVKQEMDEIEPAEGDYD